MRVISFLLFLVALALVGCAESHGLGGDAGPLDDGGSCGPQPFIFCVSDCGGDAGYAPICSGGAWACPPGTRDASTCPPTCPGPAPEGCVCVGTEWRCDGTCPPDLNPWDPTDPNNVCSVEGAECSSGSGDQCGGAMFCTCIGHLWQCAVAEPDPVCWCGREPSEGDRCVEEGAMCGECCPTPGGPGWAPMICAGGHWTAAACPPGCPAPEPSPCPANTASVLGQACGPEGAFCGDACCDDAIVCQGGRWEPGPVADCTWCSAWACGDGNCHDGEYCHQGCGPTDGPEYFCEPAAGCSSCDCLPNLDYQRCEMVDGHPLVIDVGCG